MPVEVHYETSHGQIILNRHSKTASQQKRLDQIIDQLFEALEIIGSRLADEDIYYHGLNITGKYHAEESFMPWCDEAVAAWAELATSPIHHERLKAWLVQIEKLIVKANGLDRHTESIWEEDEVQLGEPAISVFAMIDKTFIPYYERLLRVWDMAHEVSQGEMIYEIVKKHGICAETEDLLYCRIIDRPYDGWPHTIEYLYPLLKELCNDLPNHHLFQRIVTELNNRFAEENPEEYTQIIENIRANPKAPVTGRAKERELFGHCPHEQGLWDDADLVLARLDAAI